MKSNSAKSSSSSSDDALAPERRKSAQCKTCRLHQFTFNEAQSVRDSLLQWYDKNKRDLPWRRITAKEKDRNRRGYAVWVSEVMLQQTQVATVVDYYNKWMERWPTLQDLSRATLEEVNEMWAGLGYYSRARRLHEGSKKVVNEMNGEMPENAENLVKYLPGVGKYTAGAIASIAFNEPTGVVDGNVVRVLSRLRIIGSVSSSSPTVDAFWKLVSDLIDKNQPGNFNQAMMELGATVCTPKIPQCKKCPVQEVCLAYKQAESLAHEKKGAGLRSYLQSNVEKTEQKNVKNTYMYPDIEDLGSRECELCLPDDGSWKKDLGVCNYPRKQKLKEARQEKVAVCILESQEQGKNDEPMLFICKRPATGLLAGLWEFPNVIVASDVSEESKKAEIHKFLRDEFEVVLNGEEKKVSLGEVQHIFSHIHHTYIVQKIVVVGKPSSLTSESASGRSTKWVTMSEFSEAAVSTAMKKVFNLYKNNGHQCNRSSGIKRKHANENENRKQRVLESFFQRK